LTLLQLSNWDADLPGAGPPMEQDRLHRFSRFHRAALSWCTFACGLVVGLMGVVLFGHLGVMWVSNDPALPTVLKDKELLVFLAIVSGVSLVGSFVGLRNRRRAGWLCLLTAPAAGLYLGWANRFNPATGNFSLLLLAWGFAVGSFWLALMGASWLAGERAGWPPLLSSGTKDVPKRAEGHLQTLDAAP
jgi:uncharacterized membrane protein HdeD (DUF308 family)